MFVAKEQDKNKTRQNKTGAGVLPFFFGGACSNVIMLLYSSIPKHPSIHPFKFALPASTKTVPVRSYLSCMYVQKKKTPQQTSGSPVRLAGAILRPSFDLLTYLLTQETATPSLSSASYKLRAFRPPQIDPKFPMQTSEQTLSGARLEARERESPQ